MKKLIIIIASVVILALIFAGCSKENKKTVEGINGTVSCSGSTALLPIVKQGAEDFMSANANVTVTTAGGGSGTGLQQASDGIVNIGDSDVFAKAGSQLVDHQVALEPFSFIVNNGIKVSNLTTQQLVDIFSGKITNWKDVGGADMKIAIIMRSASSGTRMTIQSLVMDKYQANFATSGVVQDSSGAVKSTVSKTPGAIGYIDFAYIDASLKALSYNGVTPTIENVKNKKYTLTSTGHMYTKGEPSVAVAAFIKYIQSAAFQNKVLPVYKFVPLVTSK